MSKYYKVVIKYDGNLMSCLYNGLPPNDMIHLSYSTKHTTYPTYQYSKLFVFKDIKDAVSFIDYKFDKNLVIFEAEITNPIPLIKMSTTSLNDEKFWKIMIFNDYKCNDMDGFRDCPKGTYGADSVRLIKEVC